MNENDDILLFADETSNNDLIKPIHNTHNILIVDDEKEVHSVTTLVLNNRIINNHKLKLFSVYSAKEAISFLEKNNDIALILLDVVMEEENSGLKLVKYIREVMNNRLVRIILRTGHPGSAPEDSVITSYDINDYKSKTELTSEKLFTTVYSSLRTYDELVSNNKMLNEITGLKNFLKSIIESMPSAIITTDRDLFITHTNESALQLLKDDVKIKSDTKFQTAFTDFSFMSEKLIKIVSGENPTKFLDYKRIKISTNGLKYYDILAVPVNNNPDLGFVIRIDDVTEQELKDRQLKQIQKMELVGSLAGGLAHDFNNALGGIIGMISLIKFELASKPDLIIEDFIDTMEQASNHAKGMISQLQALTTTNETKYLTVNLGQIVKRITKFCRTTFDKSIVIDCCSIPDNFLIHGDPTQIEQVLLNLCINAYHAMTVMTDMNEMTANNDKTGNKLCITIKEIIADDSFLISHPEAVGLKYYILQVTDYGVGISKKNLAKIFDPFFTTKPKGKGSGLGLAMVNTIVKNHNGFIDVYSEENSGTTFSVYIPAIENEETRSSTQKNLKVTTGKGLILIVEDIEIMAYTIESMLKKCGYDVLTAYDGHQGIDYFKQHSDQVICCIIDMDIPKKTGIALIRDIKLINRSIPIIASSGLFDEERRENLTKLGVAVHLEKPFDIYTLSDLVSKVTMNQMSN